MNGPQYEFIRATDLDRDGMALECNEIGSDGSRALVLEAFWCDADGTFTFTAYQIKR